MQVILLIIHLMIAIGLVSVVLLQRSEGGALGIGGGGLGGIMNVRSTANILTRITVILATSFLFTSLLLAILSERGPGSSSIIDQIAPPEQQRPTLPTLPTEFGEPPPPEETSPTEDTPPTGETTPTEDTPPTGETTPTEDTPPQE